MNTATNKAQNGCPDATNVILVIEDNPQAAKLLSLYIAQAGYRALVAENGCEALELAARCRPTAITLDLLLPDQDGWQVLTELKASELTRDIPVMIVSVLDRQALGFHLGAAAYLVKPVERSEFLHVLQRCMPRAGEAMVCRKVMAVQTDLDELNLLAMVLAQQNHQVIQALGPEEAACLALCAHPDVVVTNLLAMGADFRALMEALQAAPETAHIPVLTLTDGLLDPDGGARASGEIELVLLHENATTPVPSPWQGEG